MSQDGAGQGGGRGGAGPTEQLPVGVAEVDGVDGVDGVFLKAPQVFMEAAAAALAVEAGAAIVVPVEVGSRDALCHVDAVGAALPPQGGLSAGRGGRLAVGAAVAARRRPLHRRHPDGGDGLGVGVEGGCKSNGGREGQIGVDRVWVEAHVSVVKIRIVGN